jgi:hypothetical protein
MPWYSTDIYLSIAGSNNKAKVKRRFFSFFLFYFDTESKIKFCDTKYYNFQPKVSKFKEGKRDTAGFYMTNIQKVKGESGCCYGRTVTVHG